MFRVANLREGHDLNAVRRCHAHAHDDERIKPGVTFLPHDICLEGSATADVSDIAQLHKRAVHLL
jgi:hypothetical protein